MKYYNTPVDYDGHHFDSKAERDRYIELKLMQDMGVKTLVCTDISKDGAMRGTNRQLYRELAGRLALQIVASGGVSSMDDVRALADLQLYGAIIGKAYYTGAIDLKEAIGVAE